MAAIKLFEKGLLAHEEIVSGIKRVWLEGVEPEINSAQKAVVFKVNLKKPLGIKHCFFIEFVANPKSESECFLSIAPNSDFFKDLISSYPEEIAQSVLTNALISAIQKMTEIYKVNAHFSQKCIKKLKDIKASGKSIIFVSHDLNSLKLLCDRIILLKSGKVVQDGDPQDVLDAYNYLITQIGKNSENLKELDFDYGTKEVVISKVLMRKEADEVRIACCGDEVTFEIEIIANKDIKNASFGFLIKDKFGQDIYGTNTNLLGMDLDFKKDKKYLMNFDVKLNIGAGFYTVTLALHSKDTHLEECYHWIDNIFKFEVVSSKEKDFIGICKLNSTVHLKEIDG